MTPRKLWVRLSEWPPAKCPSFRWWLNSLWYYYWQRHRQFGWPPMDFAEAWEMAFRSNRTKHDHVEPAWGGDW